MYYNLYETITYIYITYKKLNRNYKKHLIHGYSQVKRAFLAINSLENPLFTLHTYMVHRGVAIISEVRGTDMF